MSRDPLIKHYYGGKDVRALCHIKDSIYLVGFNDYRMKVWDEQTDTELINIISNDWVQSIKRVSTNVFITKS